jgi:hypothetical protein
MPSNYTDKPTSPISPPIPEDAPWGGLRENSAEIHKHRVLRDFKCEWCGEPFKAYHPLSRFCSAGHRVKAFRSQQPVKIPKPKRLTPLMRKGKMFRPPRHMVIKALDDFINS